MSAVKQETNGARKRSLEDPETPPSSVRPKLGLGTKEKEHSRNQSDQQKERSGSLDFDFHSVHSLDLQEFPTSSSSNNYFQNSTATSSNGKTVKTPAAAPVRLKPRTHQQVANELYVGLVQEMIFSDEALPGFTRKIPLDRRTALGFLLNPLRVASVMERWSPYEIALFEAAILLYGKNFTLIHRAVGSKSVKEVIAFYYDWKKTAHYETWKKTYVEDEREMPHLD